MYRLNLEEGRFLTPFQTEATTINSVDINPAHHLIVCGTKEGKVEAWDPRARSRVGILDCALHAVTPETQFGFHFFPKFLLMLISIFEYQDSRVTSIHHRQVP